MKYLLLVLPIFIIVGCAGKSIVERSTRSQLELREMQSEMVNSTDNKHICKIIVQVLQDDEYTIDNLALDLGYFTATKEIDGGKEKYKAGIEDIYYPIAIYKASQLGRNILEVKATISVRIQKDNSKIRSSFISTLRDKDGKTLSIKTIDDPKFYQEFYAKVSKAIFLQNNAL